MEPNTTGQRIAQRRKILGLSQENLGQELGVSRQAISKWESDATTPEIGKLIAMSHLFGVSIGWLLCEEEQPGTAHAEAFTEEQLRLLEKVIQKQPAVPRWQKVLMVLMLLCSAASLLLALRANDRADDAHVTYRDQISWLFENYGGAQSQLDSISAQLRDLQEQDDIFADYEFSAVAWSEWSGADVTLRGTPQSWNDSDRGVLVVLREGQEISRTEAAWDGFRLTATAGLAKQDDLEYRFLRICTDGSRTQQELYAPGYAHLTGVLSFNADADAARWEWADGALRLTEMYTITISYPQLPPKSETAQWEKVDLVLLRNGEEVCRRSAAEFADEGDELLTEPISTADPDYRSAQRVMLTNRHGELAMDLPELEEGDKVSLWVEAEFRAGDQLTEFEDELLFWYYKP